MFVLGVDPGLTRCGYGVIHRDGSRLEALAAGVLRTDSGAEPAVRLADLHREVGLLVDEYRPDEVAIERVLFQVNVRTAMQTGQASGVVMAAVAGAGIPVTLYSPNEVKEAVAGWGRRFRAGLRACCSRQRSIGGLRHLRTRSGCGSLRQP